MSFHGQHGCISLSYACSSFWFPQISGEVDEWHLTLQLHSGLIRYSCVPQVHSITCLSESQTFPEAKSGQFVEFTDFTVEYCDQIHLNL